jgi:hypothetical protein
MRASEPQQPKSSEGLRDEDFDPDDRKVDVRPSRVGAADDDDVEHESPDPESHKHRLASDETDEEELAEQDLVDEVELGDGPDA